MNSAEFVYRSLRKLRLLRCLPDKAYLKLSFRAKLNRKLNLKHPQTFNEKLQWLKLYDRKPEYTRMVDKYEAKKYVAERIGEEYIIPTLGVWEHFDEIDFDALPEQFVLKCTHDSGGLVICRDKKMLDKDKAREKIEASLKQNYFYIGREWPYKNVKPRIIAEQYLEDADAGEIRDYKFFCFGGMVKCYKIDFDRFIEHHANYYSPDGLVLPFGEVVCPPILGKELNMPQNMHLMKMLAENLSAQVPFLRADFYDVNGRVYFGELTFYPASGTGRFTSDEWDKVLGSWIRLPENTGGGYVLIADGYVLWLRREQQQTIEKMEGLTDYKFYCFNGKPEFLYISKGLENHSTAKISFLTMDWKFAPFCRSDYRPFKALPPRPQCFGEMAVLAEKLSQGHKFLRVDLYQIDGKVYFSERTFSPCSGSMPFKPVEWDDKLGELIVL